MSCDNNCNTVRVKCHAGETVVLMARQKNAANGYITRAATSTISVYVRDITDDDAIVYVDASGDEVEDGTAFATPSDTAVISDTLITDSLWTRDSTGRNVTYVFTAPNVIDAVYEVRMYITDTDGNVYVPSWEAQTI